MPSGMKLNVPLRVSRPVKPASADPQVLAGYVGAYRASTGGPTVNVREEQNVLAAEVEGTRFDLMTESAQRRCSA